MRKVYLKNVPAEQFHVLQKFEDQLTHAVFTRDGGVSEGAFNSLNVRYGVGDNVKNVNENRRIICEALGIKVGSLISADQTHSKNVVIVDEDFLAKERELEINDTDAFVTDIPGIALMIQVADCQAILMYDPSKHLVAAVHAGWKGLVKNISGETIKVMKKYYGCDPAKILVGISPSLGPCCSFFTNPEKELPASFNKFTDNEKRVNLFDYSVAQLVKNGIKQENIEVAKICTQCGKGGGVTNFGGADAAKRRFFSFRGQHGICGRFGAVVMLKNNA